MVFGLHQTFWQNYWVIAFDYLCQKVSTTGLFLQRCFQKILGIRNLDLVYITVYWTGHFSSPGYSVAELITQKPLERRSCVCLFAGVLKIVSACSFARRYTLANPQSQTKIKVTFIYLSRSSFTAHGRLVRCTVRTQSGLALNRD